jgi:hypothetical protein
VVASLLLAAAQAASAQETHGLVIVGLGGTDAYRQRFLGYAKELRETLTEKDGVPADHVTVLAERVDGAPDLVQDRSTKENVMRAIGEIAARAGPSDQILVVLIGHGTAQGDEGQFNLPGPDLSAEELAAALAAFPTQTVAVVHTGSSGGGFIAPLSGPNRIVVSATRTVRERNATEFPGYFVEALAGSGADMDKDGRVSLLEAFVYARAEVARYYEEENEILVEHAVLDDNGDGEGSPDASATGADGRLAAGFRLGRMGAATAAALDDPALAPLYEERREIMTRIDGLRAARGAMTEEKYDEALEALLVELALKNREIKAREGGGS